MNILELSLLLFFKSYFKLFISLLHRVLVAAHWLFSSSMRTLLNCEFPDQGLNPGPLIWKLRVLAIRPPGKALLYYFFRVSFWKWSFGVKCVLRCEYRWLLHSPQTQPWAPFPILPSSAVGQALFMFFISLLPSCFSSCVNCFLCPLPIFIEVLRYFFLLICLTVSSIVNYTS